ncbi:MAG: hypothetical protein RIR69_1087 [Actinomycetota bacterium]
MAAKKKTARGSTKMSTAHKKALANGRNEGRIIREYLEIVEATKPKRGRRRTPESIARRLTTINTELKTADAVTKVRLIQERLNLRRELSGMKSKNEVVAAETKFVKVARSFSARNDISYDAWREFGVTPAVLKKAGITKY